MGTFSFNMGKQLSTGEGGMAVTDDDHLAAEINKRIIFGESPEVLSSNHRMTEFQAAVGVAQLRKVPGYLRTYRRAREVLDEAIADCPWLELRRPLPRSLVSPYIWSCIFRGERAGIDYGIFQAALRQLGEEFGTGFTQRPAYMYRIFRNPNAYDNKGCPYNCHLYRRKVDWKPGLCPRAEDVLPRLVCTSNVITVAEARRKAKLLKRAIELAEAGAVEPLRYSQVGKHVLAVVKDYGPLEPLEVARILEKRGIGHFTEHQMLSTMEALRDRFPFKLSHGGPRKFAYHDLSETGESLSRSA
ncbi:MAG: hypothetical protein B1H04_01925 [Planctomycetales bacterium 4484_123]|nr:MAG: hypothetical protein B1H04_01925 [Planctomycetales bacterium 4484_123]